MLRRQVFQRLVSLVRNREDPSRSHLTAPGARFLSFLSPESDSRKTYKDGPAAQFPRSLGGLLLRHYSGSSVPEREKPPSSSTSPKDRTLTEEELKVLRELEEEEEKYRRERESLKASVSEGFVPFEDHQRIIQDVIEEIWNPLPQPEKQVYQPPQEFLERGTTGVFDLPELIDLLREENCDEIVTIRIPKELDYADYMVIVTCRSPRHLLASGTYVRKRFKMKDLKKTDVIPQIISENGHQGWIALDLGNIILHLFLQNQRDYYDLEMLWSVGPMFDDLCNMKDPEIIQLLDSLK